MIDQGIGGSRRVSFTPEVAPGEFEQIRQAGLRTLQEAFTVTTTKPAGENTGPARFNLPTLEAPALHNNANDIALRIGMLQDALNQLMGEVSKTEITGRMNELQKENQKQLEKFDEQMKKAAAAAKKSAEADKKGNAFEAAGNWIQAAVSVASAVVTLAAASAQFLVNPAGSAALVIASAALLGTAAVQVTLALDATLQAAGQEGFLSDTDKAKMKKAIEIMTYIAIAASALGLISGLVVAFRQAGAAGANSAAREGARHAATKATPVATRSATNAATKEVVEEGAKKAAARYVNYAGQQAFRDMFVSQTRSLGKYVTNLAITQGVGQGAVKTTTATGKLETAELRRDASDLREQADLAEAAAKALSAQIAKLQALLQQCQEELQEMMEQGQETLAIIYGCVDESASSMTRVQHSLGA